MLLTFPLLRSLWVCDFASLVRAQTDAPPTNVARAQRRVISELTDDEAHEILTDPNIGGKPGPRRARARRAWADAADSADYETKTPFFAAPGWRLRSYRPSSLPRRLRAVLNWLPPPQCRYGSDNDVAM